MLNYLLFAAHGWSEPTLSKIIHKHRELRFLPSGTSESAHRHQRWPAVFAGYLGGPIGALITGLIGALYVSTNGDPIPILGISMNLALPSVGLALRYLRPLQDWPAIPRVATGYILIGFAAVLIVTILLTRSLTPSNDGYQISALFALVFGTVGVFQSF